MPKNSDLRTGEDQKPADVEATDQPTDAETAPGPVTDPDAKATAKEPTHTNPYGDKVHVREGMHAFVEARGYKPL